MNIKVLSIQEPWASLIIKGFKDVENRKWKTGYRGRLYIQVPQKYDSIGEQWIKKNIIGKVPKITSLNLDILKSTYKSGKIIGYVDLIDCVDKLDNIWFFGPYGLILKNPVKLKTPIPCKGQLQIYNFEI